MRQLLAYGFVWIVGLRDCYLTRWMVELAGTDSEANPLVRPMLEVFGSDAVWVVKLVGLVGFTATMLAARNRSQRATRWGTSAGVVVSTALLIWWEVWLTQSGFRGV